MRRDPKYDVLFEPVRIGPKMMKNRFYQTPHCTGLGAHFPGAQAHLRGMKADYDSIIGQPVDSRAASPPGSRTTRS